MTERDHTLPLGALLRLLAGEIDGPRQAILAAEQHLATALRSGPTVEGSARDLQSIDLALQILDDLERFIARLGDALPQDLHVDAGPALRGLTLERLAVSFAHAFGTPAPAVHAHPSIELF